MFLKHKPSGDMVEVLTLNDLQNPLHKDIIGRFHSGEELQEPTRFAKSDLVFPSGEKLPRCWLEADYRSKS